MSDQHHPPGDEPPLSDKAAFSVPGERGIDPLPRDDASVQDTEAYNRLDGDRLDDSFDTSLFAAPSNASSLGHLGKYEILKVIGKGGMGVVFRGFDQSLHRPVAIKVLSRQLASSPTARRRFTREARAAAAVNHPNVVTIHAVEAHDGLPYLVMEFVDGESLHDRIRARAPLPLADVLRFGAQIASGLAAAHAQGVIHRDIKPANIMLEGNVDRVKITDFGLARVAVDNADLTSQGHQLGTPAYMSPEQVSGNDVDERTDLFSFGCVMYAMISGHSPFRGAHSFDAARKILEETPPSLDRLDAEVPPFLAEIVDRLLAKKRASRFRTAAEVADLLNHYTTRLNQSRTDELGTVLRGKSLGGTWHRTLTITVPAVLLVAIGLTIALTWRPWEQPRREASREPASGVRHNPSGSPTVGSPAVVKPVGEPLLRGTLTVAQSGTSQFTSIHEALRRAGPGATIEVRDDVTYHGAIVIADAERLRNISLVATRGAKLTAPFGSSVIKLEATPGVAIRGFQMDAFVGQHGIEITGDCAGAVVENITAERLPNVNSTALINFAYLHAGASGTEESPIVLRNLRVHGGGHSIAIGELGREKSARLGPVRWIRVEACTLVNPDGRTDCRLFLLNDVADILITRNTFADAEMGISMLLKEAGQAQRVRIHHNTFRNLGSLMMPDADHGQDEQTISANLMSHTDRVTPGQLPPSELPTSWFSGNAWVDHPATTDGAISAVAAVVTGGHLFVGGSCRRRLCATDCRIVGNPARGGQRDTGTLRTRVTREPE